LLPSIWLEREEMQVRDSRLNWFLTYIWRPVICYASNVIFLQ